MYEQQWSIFKISKKKHLFPRAATVLTEDEVDRMEASEVVQAFRSLQPLRRKIFRGIKNQAATTPALTMCVISLKLRFILSDTVLNSVAILSIVLGYVVSRFMPLPVTPATLVKKDESTVSMKPAINLSEHVATSFVTPMSSAVSLSSVKEISISIAPSSLSTAPTNRHGSTVESGKFDVRKDKPINVAVASGSKSLIISQQPPPSASELSIRSKALAVFQQAMEQTSFGPIKPASSISTQSRTEAMYSLSTRLTSSLAEIFNVKALAGVLRADMKELLDALDELLQALGAQVASAVHATEGLRDHLRRRNQHAQRKARMLREKGERMVSSLGKRARGHVARARSQARAMKDAISAEVATVSKKHHEHGLIRKMRERQQGQSRKLRHGVGLAKGCMGF